MHNFRKFVANYGNLQDFYKIGLKFLNYTGLRPESLLFLKQKNNRFFSSLIRWNRESSYFQTS